MNVEFAPRVTMPVYVCVPVVVADLAVIAPVPDVVKDVSGVILPITLLNVLLPYVVSFDIDKVYSPSIVEPNVTDPLTNVNTVFAVSVTAPVNVIAPVFNAGRVIVPPREDVLFTVKLNVPFELIIPFNVRVFIV